MNLKLLNCLLIFSFSLFSKEITFNLKSQNNSKINFYRLRIDYLYHNLYDFHLFCKELDSDEFHYVNSSPMGEMYTKIFWIKPFICSLTEDFCLSLFDIDCKNCVSIDIS